jgi:hypothetical protein
MLFDQERYGSNWVVKERTDEAVKGDIFSSSGNLTGDIKYFVKVYSPKVKVRY